MGIFEVQLVVMYGEGTNAFFRLQEELMKRTPGRGLFAWTARTGISYYNSMIAGDIRCFKSRVPDISPLFHQNSPWWSTMQTPQVSDVVRGVPEVCVVLYHIRQG